MVAGGLGWKRAGRAASPVARLIFGALIAAVACAAVTPPGAPRYQVVGRMAGPDGDYDYVSVDEPAGRLFVGRDDGVMAVDLATGRVHRRFLAARGVAAVLPIPGTPLMLATAGDEDRAILFDRRTGTVRQRIAAGRDPDGAAFDPVSRLAFVMNGGSNDVSFIDVSRGSVVATVPIGGKPEAAVSDGRGHLFVNVEDKGEIAVIDVARRRVVARDPIAGCRQPTGIAFDRASDLLVSVCHNNMAALVDARSGAARGRFAIGRDADGVAIDARRRLVFISCNDGTLTIVRMDLQGRIGAREVVVTRLGARTLALAPASGRLFLPAGRMRRDRTGQSVPVPGSFGVLVVAPR